MKTLLAAFAITIGLLSAAATVQAAPDDHEYQNLPSWAQHAFTDPTEDN